MYCPHAKSDMTPCFTRDGHLALITIQTTWSCVGCERQVHPTDQQQAYYNNLMDSLIKKGKRK